MTFNRGLYRGLYWAADGTSGGANENASQETQDAGEGGEPQVPETWDAFMEDQPEPVKSLFEGHVQGLRTALDTERGQRKDLEKQLRQISSQLEEGSAAKKQLEELSASLDAATQRVAFYESAPPELVNPKLGWLAAQEIDAFDRRGNVNWDAVKTAFPELFKPAKQPAPPANAGSGSGGGGTPKPFDMNAALREAAGRNRI